MTPSLIKLFNLYRTPIVLLERVPRKLVSRFGVVEARKMRIKNKELRMMGGGLYQIKRIVEKPQPKDTPSNLTIVGGYVLTPHIIGNLRSVAETLPVIANDALPLAVALQMGLIMGDRVYGWEFKGGRIDCGTLESLRKAEKTLSTE